MGALVLAAPAGAVQGPRIVSPKDGRFFTTAPVTVVVKTGESVRSLDARLNGKSVDGAFKRVGPGRWKATFAAQRLIRGKNGVAIWARQKGGRWRYASSAFVLGKRARSLMAVTGVGGGANLNVRLRTEPTKLTAKLNGKKLRWPIDLNPTRDETLRLAGDDGLHFGVNHLRVFAIGPGGVWDAVARKVVVKRNRPLVGAGRDRQVGGPRRIRLDGSSSAPAHSSGELTYRWQIIGKPRGSKAKLRESGSVRPLLVTDRPGHYRVRLQVTEGGFAGAGVAPGKASDIMTLITRKESVPPIGEPIKTMVSNGKSGAEADSGIKVGSTTYWLGAPRGKTAQVVMLDRLTLNPLYVASYANEKEAEQLGGELTAHGKNALTIISVPNLHGNAPKNTLLGLTAHDIGAENGFLFENWRAGWSAIGVYETENGGTIAEGTSPNPEANGANYAGELSGYLQWASGKGFVYVPGARIPFQTDAVGGSATTNKMVIGGTEYASKPLLPSCGEGGFQIEVVLAETLDPVKGETFTTHGCGPPAESIQQAEMNAYLHAISVGGERPAEVGPKLVFIQSIGQPYGPGLKVYDEIASGIEAVGGVGSAFAVNEKSPFGLSKTGYALVGSVGVTPARRAEASELWTGYPAKITGILKPDRSGAYVPELASPTGEEANSQISAIAYQPRQAWPHSSSSGDKAALKYIAEDVLELRQPDEKNSCYVPPQPDVRSMYCDGQEIGHWRENAKTLKNAPYAAGNGFAKAEWEAVQHELAFEEFRTVEEIWAMLENTEKIFSASNQVGHVGFELLAAEIEKDIQPQPQDFTTGWWLELVGNLASTGSYFSNVLDETETLTKGLGIVQGAMFEASSSLFEPNGEPVLDAYKVKTSELAREMATRFTDDIGQIGRVGDILVSDYGKLKAMRESGLLGFKPGEAKEVIEATAASTQMWSYENLLPSAYEAVQLEEAGGNSQLPEKATAFECEVGGGPDEETYYPFRSAAAGGEYKTNGSGILGVLVRVHSKLPEFEGNFKVYPQLPPASLFKPLREPKGGSLGYFEPWFWHNTFDFPSSKNRKVVC
jgi:hypothetical protein